MMQERPQPLQDTVLRHLREHKVPVTVYLANGIRLQGHVGAFDAYSILLVRDRQAQVIYKHAISPNRASEPARGGWSEEPGPPGRSCAAQTRPETRLAQTRAVIRPCRVQPMPDLANDEG